MSSRSWISTQPDEQKEQQPMKEPESSTTEKPLILRKLTLEKFSGEKSGPITDPRQSIKSDKRAKEGVVSWKESIANVEFTRQQPPPSPQDYSDAPAGSPLVSDMLPWLEFNDKHNYMSHCPPKELSGLINTRISKDGDRFLMRLASNSSFLAHSWVKTTGIGCCNAKGVRKEIIVSTGPQNRSEPQMVIMVIEKTPTYGIIGKNQKHGSDRGIGLIVNMSKGIVLLSSASAHVSSTQMNRYYQDVISDSSTPPPDNVVRLVCVSDSSAPDASSSVNCCDDSLCFRDYKTKACCLVLNERTIDFFHPVTGHQAFAAWLAWKLAGRAPSARVTKKKK
eukprot:TRINITY_DN17349_c0_g1_i1.p1 TRINITY_DN17349_c0_g1~~TRINITY_DN17349_c0_g1_i1.p1  ORF type:complete len:336 (+),score=51.07 TRINITY_DN17349_c0_g1_i1:131-1138(+)